MPTLDPRCPHCLQERTATAQRDELMNALYVIAGEPRVDDEYVGMTEKQIARAAIAKVKS